MKIGEFEGMPLHVTDSGDWAPAWYEPEMRCYCHVVRKAGVTERWTSPSLAGPFTAWTSGPFPGEMTVHTDYGTEFKS